ncbi:hypothetical protein, partial [Paraburkholderia guartelaensis]|uniref:hypothetical protein n=1 Tax=Paraburkholderia guartelaensis TaxID=2546446 RepID=UPI00197E7972
KNDIRSPPHQAPTLIGCKFLKIVRESAVKTAQLPASFCVAASAAEKRDYEESFSLRQPLFFAHRLKKLLTPASAGFLGGPRCLTSETSNCEGGKSYRPR